MLITRDTTTHNTQGFSLSHVLQQEHVGSFHFYEKHLLQVNLSQREAIHIGSNGSVQNQDCVNFGQGDVPAVPGAC